MIPIIIFHFTTMIVFYLKDYKEIKNKIKQIIYLKKNWKLFNKKDNPKIENNKKRKSTIINKVSYGLGYIFINKIVIPRLLNKSHN